MFTRTLSLLLASLATASLVSCGSPSAIEPKLSSLQATIFTPSCNFASCHGGGAGGLNLKDQPHKALVGVESPREIGKKRVIPGNSKESLLYLLLLGKVGSSRPMPLNGDPLSDEKIKAVTAWIDQGAPND